MGSSREVTCDGLAILLVASCYGNCGISSGRVTRLAKTLYLQTANSSNSLLDYSYRFNLYTKTPKCTTSIPGNAIQGAPREWGGVSLACPMFTVCFAFFCFTYNLLTDCYFPSPFFSRSNLTEDLCQI